MTDQTALALVFSKAPPWTDEELALAITELREKRSAYLSAPKKAPKAPKSTGQKVDISAMDIEL